MALQLAAAKRGSGEKPNTPDLFLPSGPSKRRPGGRNLVAGGGVTVESPAVRVGLDRLGELPELMARLRGARVGVLAHPASVSRELAHVADVLEGLGVRPRLLF